VPRLNSHSNPSSTGESSTAKKDLTLQSMVPIAKMLVSSILVLQTRSSTPYKSW